MSGVEGEGEFKRKRGTYPAATTRSFCWRFAIHGDKQCVPRPTCGLCGVRIGEASHPGPSARRRRRVRSSRARDNESDPDPTLDDLERDDVAVSVDTSPEDEPVARPKNGRHVVPRMEERVHEEMADTDNVLDDQIANIADSELCPTVVASPRVLFAAGGGVSVCSKKRFHPLEARSLGEVDHARSGWNPVAAEAHEGHFGDDGL